MAIYFNLNSLIKVFTLLSVEYSILNVPETPLILGIVVPITPFNLLFLICSKKCVLNKHHQGHAQIYKN